MSSPLLQYLDDALHIKILNKVKDKQCNKNILHLCFICITEVDWFKQYVVGENIKL